MALTKTHNRMIDGSVANIIDFGAVDDNSTDCSAAVQAALDTGKPVYVPYAVNGFRIANTVYLNNNAVLFGDKQAPQNPQFRPDDGIVAFNVLGNFVTIKDLSIRVTKSDYNSFPLTTGVGILVRALSSYGPDPADWTYVAFTTIEDVYVYGAYKSIQMEAHYWSTIRNSHTNKDFYGIALGIDQRAELGSGWPRVATTVTIEKTYCHGNNGQPQLPGSYGMWLGASHGLTVIDCVTEYYETGIYADRCSATTCSGHYMENVDYCWRLVSPFADFLIQEPYVFNYDATNPVVTCSFTQFTWIGGRIGFKTGTGTGVFYSLSVDATANIIIPPSITNGTKHDYTISSYPAVIGEGLSQYNPATDFNMRTKLLVGDGTGSSSAISLFTDGGVDSLILFETAATGGNSGGYIGYITATDTMNFSTNGALQLQLGGDGHLSPYNDNLQTLGKAGSRWSEVFAGTGTINTSDARLKQQERSLSDAERAVAIKIKGLLKAFKFNDAVSQKGEDARIHFGVYAQEVADAFTSEGLDPTKYALFCYDEWEAEGEIMDGDRMVQPASEAGNAYGIRYDELFAFIISSL